jgi:hypothetical protein
MRLLIHWLFTVLRPAQESLTFHTDVTITGDYRWMAAKFRPMLGAQGLWAGMGLYSATPAVTQSLGFSGLIRRTTLFNSLLRHAREVLRTYNSYPDPHGFPFNRLLWHTRGCWEPIFTWMWRDRVYHLITQFKLQERGQHLDGCPLHWKKLWQSSDWWWAVKSLLSSGTLCPWTRVILLGTVYDVVDDAQVTDKAYGPLVESRYNI